MIKNLRGNVNAEFSISSMESKFDEKLDILVKFADLEYMKRIDKDSDG